MNVPQCYQHVIAALKGVIHSEAGIQAFCPAHDDERVGGSRGLSVRIGGGGKLLVKCHSGCSSEDIMSCLGLSADDLFPDNCRATGRSRESDGESRSFVCAYDYRDEARRLLFQVVRWRKTDGSKTFTQRRPNPDFDMTKCPSKSNPEYVSGVEGVRRVLYRLPDLIEMGRKFPLSTVFVHEGEKAVDLGWKMKMIGTCSPMGAGKWNSMEFVKPLVGRNVVVIEDDDPVNDRTGVETGQKHANDVCLSLYGSALSLKKVRLTCLHQRGDFVDWVEANGGQESAETIRASMRKIVDGTPEWEPKPSDLTKSLKRILGSLSQLKLAHTPIRSTDELLGKTRRAWIEFENALAFGGAAHDEMVRLASLLAVGIDEGITGGGAE